MLIAALLLPLRSLTAKVKKRQDPAPAWLVRESIKWNNAEATAVAELHTQAPELAAVHQQLQVRLLHRRPGRLLVASLQRRWPSSSSSSSTCSKSCCRAVCGLPSAAEWCA